MENTQYYSHLCACGCGGKIKIIKRHLWSKIPKYITGHNSKGRISPNKGKKLTEEHRQNMSIAKKGKKRKPFSEEHRQKISESLTGENNPNFGIIRPGELSPNWQGGKSFEEYTEKFNKYLKKKIKKRDNYICQDPNCEHKTDIFHIHHIDYDKKNNSLENLITLCISCHIQTNGKKKRLYYTEFYQNIMINRLTGCLL